MSWVDVYIHLSSIGVKVKGEITRSDSALSVFSEPTLRLGNILGLFATWEKASWALGSTVLAWADGK